ncbi:Protein KRI1 [Rhynchospora pubera]|uniref:Protein KRI1 n=1 Tax=Rhynchospora pubera TaxID=906938 RepID=A0AAV8CBH4_9POAL|nr:Protein KRI1 [Rhynchospora pubera]
MAKMDLFEACGDGSGSGSDSDFCKIEINKEFARRLEHNKKREELQRYEEYKKQGRISDSDSDSDSDSSSDSDETYLTRDDSEFFKLLARVKENDPEVLKKDVKLYESEGEGDDEEGDKKMKKEGKKGKKKKEKPMYLKDVVARDLLENGPEFAGEEEITEKYSKKLYNEEQKAGLQAFLEADKEAFGSDDNEESDDLFKAKERKGEESEDDEQNLEVEKHLDAYFDKDENLDENERFLKEFFRKKSWIDREKGKGEMRDELHDISEDEEELERQDKYEAEYNFRHEEEGMTDRVLGHSRVIEGSVRKKDSSRKQQRKSKKERMEQAERERREELKHLKNLKKKEIQEKLERIKNVAGIGDAAGCNLSALDLEDEFDPDDYDKKMQEVFGSDYYEEADVDPGFGPDETEGELEKPDFSKEDELLGLEEGWDAVDESNKSNGDGFEKARERYMQKKAVENSGADDVTTTKGKISYKEVELDKELEEYYKLDYEDTIGDLKTRFKYRSVPANRYGLKSWEILDASDKDLNQYVPMKKIAPYREKEWKVTYHQMLKKDLLLSKDEKTGKKHNDKKNRDRTKDENNIEKLEGENEKDEEQSSRKSRRRKRQAELKLPQSRLEAYGKVPPKKPKKN